MTTVMLAYAEASYTAHCLESELVNIGLALEMLEHDVPTTSLYDLLDRTPEQLNRLIGEAAKMDRSTLGQLLGRARLRLPLSAATEACLGAAVERRNYLIHHFFFVHCFAMFTEDGRASMEAELESLEREFSVALADARLLRKAVFGLVGLPQEQLFKDFVQALGESADRDEEPPS